MNKQYRAVVEIQQRMNKKGEPYSMMIVSIETDFGELIPTYEVYINFGLQQRFDLIEHMNNQEATK